MSKRFAALVLICASLAATAGLADDQNGQASRLPVVNLVVAYRLLQDEKLGSLVYLSQLWCSRNSCELITAALNGCLPAGALLEDAKGFEIGLTRAGTDDGSLEIVMFHCDKQQGVIIVKKHWLGAEITYRFGFSLDCAKPDRAIVSQLESFDGVGVQPYPDHVDTWTLVPFKGGWVHGHVRWTPDCPLVLPGVPK